jgi:hypothetical protein
MYVCHSLFTTVPKKITIPSPMGYAKKISTIVTIKGCCRIEGKQGVSFREEALTK